MVYLRPSTLFVIDQLASAQPRKWEWNLHTGTPLAGSPADFMTQAGAVRLCGVVASRDPLELFSASGYTPAPAKPAQPHYWSRFAYRQAAGQGLFVAVLRVDCAQAPPRIRFTAHGAKISTAGMLISVGKNGVTARPAATARTGRGATALTRRPVSGSAGRLVSCSAWRCCRTRRAGRRCRRPSCRRVELGGRHAASSAKEKCSQLNPCGIRPALCRLPHNCRFDHPSFRLAGAPLLR